MRARQLHGTWQAGVRVLLACMLLLAGHQAAASSTKVVYGADAFFSWGSAELDETRQEKLLRLVAYASTSSRGFVMVAGHADASEADATELGLRRAKAVKSHLVHLGFPPSRIYVESKGDQQPLADSPDARNRRVDVEYVGNNQTPAELAGFTLMAEWLARQPPRPTEPEMLEQWSSETPLAVLPRVAPEHRDRFLTHLLLAAIQAHDDELLREALTFDEGASLLATPVAPALHAQLFGTPFARAALREQAEGIPPDDPRRLEAAQRRWCAVLHNEPAAASIEAVLPDLPPFEALPSEEQFQWVSCAAARLDDLLWLKRHGANLDARRAEGHSALHAAVAAGRPAAVQALLKAGADPNARGAEGLTPLHLLSDARVASRLPPPLQRRLRDMLVEAGAKGDLDDGGRNPSPGLEE